MMQHKEERRTGSALQDRRRSAGPGPCGLGLSRMLADGRAAVKTPKTFPPAPLKGAWGTIFAQIFRAVFGENGKSGNICAGDAAGISRKFLPDVGGL